MDWKMKKQLLEKYWNGETTLEEEQWLKANISASDEELTMEERKYFEQLNAFVELSPEEAFDMSMFEESSKKEAKIMELPFYRKFRKTAVILLILMAAAAGKYYMTSSQNASTIAAVEVEEEEDPEKAFEIAKASLLLISQKMNKGTEHVKALEKFDMAHDKIQAK